MFVLPTDSYQEIFGIIDTVIVFENFPNTFWNLFIIYSC